MNVERRRVEGLVALIAVQFCFGLSPLFAKWTLDPEVGFEPRALTGWRILFGAVLLGGIALRQHGRRAFPPRRDLARLLACALLGVVFNMWLYLEGVSRTSVVHAGLLVVQIPVFTYAAACLWGLERVQVRRLLGIGLALAGAAVLVLERSSAGGGTATSLGDALILINCSSYAVYLLVARPLLGRHPTLVVIAWIFWFSLPFVPLFFQGVPVWPADPPARVLTSFGYTLFFGTFAAYLLNTYALARLPASTVAVFIFLQPLVAGVAGVLALGERITPALSIAAAVLLAGMLLVSRPGRAPGGPSRRA